MNNEQTISWIFLALALSSDKSLTDLANISNAADYINHSVPTQEEMQNSIYWLINKKLILKIEDKYSLSEFGKEIYTETCQETKGLMNMWKNLENKISVFI